MPTTPAPAPVRTGLALVVIMVGVLMAAVDTTIVVLALPDLEQALHVSLSGVVWVIISYLLVITVLATQLGRLGDMFGRVRMYETGFLVFIVGSGLCALATNEATIIGFRVLQGIGGAMLTANSGAVIADTFPPERRGRAYGFNAVGFNVGAILGILLGGVIITYVSWRWIFWINVPAGIGAYLLAVRILRDRGERQRQRLDLAGMLLLGAGLFGVLWAMTQLATKSFNSEVVVTLGAGVVLLVGFVALERRRRAPMLDLSLFRIPTVSPTLLASLFQALANFAVLFLVIMYLQGVRGFTPLHASLLLVPGYLVGGVMGPYGGRLADRLGAVWPATIGLAIEIAALAMYSQLAVTTATWVVVVAAAVNGFGTGLFFPANTAAVMKAVPGPQYGIASGMLRTFANVGMVFSFAVAILVAARAIPRDVAFAIFVGTTHLARHLAGSFTDGLHAAFYSSMAFMALAVVLSATRVFHQLRLRGTAGAPGRSALPPTRFPEQGGGMEDTRRASPAGSCPTLADVAEELARHADAGGMVEPGVAAQLVAEHHWTGRLVEVLAVLTDDPDRMGYLAGGRHPEEVATWLAPWAESPLSLDDIRLIVASGGWDPEPFVVLAKAGLLEPLLRLADGTPRRVRGELAGAWVSDELALASDADVLETVSRLLEEEAGDGRAGAGQEWRAR